MASDREICEMAAAAARIREVTAQLRRMSDQVAADVLLREIELPHAERRFEEGDDGE
jgi:hypothetical protein